MAILPASVRGFMTGGFSMATTPPKRDVGHMLNGPDDSHPIKKLCSGWVKSYDMTQSMTDMRSIDNPTPFRVPGGVQELTLKIMLTEGMDPHVAQMMISQGCDILIRSRK
jgi:hypothetical protein